MMLNIRAGNAGIVDPTEIIITGVLYKRIAEKSAWSKRKVILCNQYLYQYTYHQNNGSDIYKGKFDITNCSVKIINLDDVPKGRHGIVIENLNENRSVFFCTEGVEELSEWSKKITNQVCCYMFYDSHK
jgi:hypothetical protein